MSPLPTPATNGHAMQTEQSAPETTDLRAYLAVLRARKWSIAIVTLVVVGAALAYSFTVTPVYTSEARVYVTPVGLGTPAPVVNLDTEAGLAQSLAVALIVQKDEHVRTDPTQIVKGLAVSVETNSAILDLRYTDPSPATAQRYANAFAQAYLTFRRQQATQQVQDLLSTLQQQIDSVQADLATVNGKLQQTKDPATRSELLARQAALIARLGVLQQQLESTQVSIGSQSGGQVIASATLPASPSSPSHVRDALLALIVGLALGVGVAFLRERLDDSLRGRDDLEQAIRAPILAVIPHVPDWRDPEFPDLVTKLAPKSASAEAYRTLRTNLQFIGHTDDFKILCVTSPSLGEGKTTTVANLGLAMGRAGRRVIIVSCDLRRPRLHRFFGVENGTGLSSVLSGQADVASTIRRPGPENVIVMPSGPVPPNPAELLASDRMVGLLDELRGAADFVILDTPPLLAVSDALSLAAKSDGSLIVADANSTTRGAARHTRMQLDQVGARVVGAVLNNFDPWSARFSYDGYKYSYAYRYPEESSNGSPENGKSVTPERGGKSKERQRPSSSEADSMWR